MTAPTVTNPLTDKEIWFLMTPAERAERHRDARKFRAIGLKNWAANWAMLRGIHEEIADKVALLRESQDKIQQYIGAK